MLWPKKHKERPISHRKNKHFTHPTKATPVARASSISLRQYNAQRQEITFHFDPMISQSSHHTPSKRLNV
jgi:hypothetical protein